MFCDFVVSFAFGNGGGIIVNLVANGATNAQVLNLNIHSVEGGNGSGASLTQDSTGELTLTLVIRNAANGPLTCGSTIVEIIQ